QSIQIEAAGVNLSPVQGLDMSPATACDSAVIYWTASSGATSYKVFRSSDNNFANAAQITQTTATAWRDPRPALSTSYYWVKVVTPCGDSPQAGPVTVTL